MTCKLIQLPVTLTVKGPVLTVGFTTSGWGLDTTFYRNWEGKFALSGTHIRGKLKEAMREIITLSPAGKQSCKDLFGAESRNEQNNMGLYSPLRGMLKISDFINDVVSTGNVRTRIRIEPERRTAQEGAVIISESPFLSGEYTEWHGTVELFASDAEKIGILEQVKQAFHFIHAVGADKTVGYGRVAKVQFGDSIETEQDEPQQTGIPKMGFKLSLVPTEPFMIGGIRQADNVFVSESIIPGSIIKGSFAAGLNRIAGNTDITTPIDDNNSTVRMNWPLLARYFSDLRFLQAIPSEKKNSRPYIKPLSGVQYGGTYRNIAFDNEDSCYAKGKTPVAFQIDWKSDPDDLPKKYCQPDLLRHPVTRTAINSETRKADDSQLYSFHMVAPKKMEIDKKQNKSWKDIYWNGGILFPNNISDTDKAELTKELHSVHQLALRYLGKRQSVFLSELSPDFKPFDQNKLGYATCFAITLQAPAIIINPEDMARQAQAVFDDREILNDLYCVYWKQVFNDTADFIRFFARQELQGGYLGMRFQKNGYRPFYLTSAGSIFVFQIKDKTKLTEILNRLDQYGLDLPAWSKQAGEPTWKSCPFVSENGFGEIRITFWNKE
ncbi:RAMP superfamily CRISPR-associated protein [Desulfobacterium sp. N47]|uniref:CRISPR type III-associated protein domain-containing protein n=1 Tax=uncultured Desulfobacterium sp. TaxID=201089 RepID=E1YF67_9BACT|nr:hypothetical protein N47_J01920 [uncultured Desulfobacterium sp.]